MKVEDFVRDLVDRLTKKEIFLDSNITIHNEKDGKDYEVGTVQHVLESVNVHVEPIDDIPGKYCLLNNRTKMPISSCLYEFSHKKDFSFVI